MKLSIVMLGLVGGVTLGALVGAWSAETRPLAAHVGNFAEAESEAGQNPAGASSGDASTAVPPAARGQKLMLKDGGFQLVRKYERNGDRVRYLSAERGDWEELPAAMVDWDATAKAAAAESKAADKLVLTVHQQQVESQAQVPMDVDVSLRVGAGVFLPAGDGMFAVQGKSVMKLEQVGSENKTDKKLVVAQVITGTPLVPSKHNIVLPGAHAKFRVVNDGNPLEFFLREAPFDPEHPSPIITSGATGDSGPDVELVVATVKGGKRQLESITARFGQKIADNKKVISVQRWDVAPNVYRFTLSETLPGGEYALAEILPDGMNLFVWDFGVDATSQMPAVPAKK
jgi:hypothetical protein